MPALLSLPSKKIGAASSLRRYLGDCGGEDVLLFNSGDRARQAADILRQQDPGIRVEARYDKVFISL